MENREPEEKERDKQVERWMLVGIAFLVLIVYCGANIAKEYGIIPTTLDGDETRIPQYYGQDAFVVDNPPPQNQGSYLNPSMFSIPFSGISPAL